MYIGSSVMVRLTKHVQVLVTPELSKEMRAEAKFQSITVNEFIRTAIKAELRRLDRQRVEDAYRENRPIKTRG
jgi:hypothetical protein